MKVKALAAVEKVAALTPGREQLAEAHRAQQAAESALEKSKASVEKAHSAIEDAESDLEKFDGLDQQIAAARAEMVKRDKTGPLPDKLVTARTARNAAREHLAESMGALTLLEAEQVASEKHWRAAVENHGHQAFLVLLRQATDLSKKLAADQERVWDMHDRLKAFDHFAGATHVPTDGARHAVMHSRDWVNLIAPLTAQPRLVAVYSPHDPVRQWVERFKTLHAALLNDPNASIE
jgi:hypothetical protein